MSTSFILSNLLSEFICLFCHKTLPTPPATLKQHYSPMNNPLELTLDGAKLQRFMFLIVTKILILIQNTMKVPLILSTLLFLAHSFVIVQHQLAAETRKISPDVVYYNGNIITMDHETPSAKSVSVKNGKIVKVSNQTLSPFHLKSRKTRYVNLKKKTMIPGFVDAHSHFSATAVLLNLNFSIASAPFGNVTSIKQMLQNAKDYIQRNNVPIGQPVYSTGYSDYKLEEHRHPTRYELDWVSTEHPIVFGHYSGHAVVANSLALALVGYTQSKEPPPGGVFDKYPNGTLTGLCKEYAVLPLLYRFQISFSQLSLEQIQKTEEVYLRSGVTTAHDIVLQFDTANKFKNVSQKLKIDVNGYYLISSPNLKSLNTFMQNYTTARFKPRGAKFVIDGSLQTYTAYLSKPYWVPKEKQYDNLDNYTYDESRSCDNQSCGENNFPYNSILTSLFLQVNKNNYDVIAHCNGDQAIDKFLEAVRFVRTSEKKKSQNRFIAIHAQTLRQDQLDSMVKLKAHPSFFSPHLYYWGQQHYKIFLGPQRANRMNPAGSAVKRNLTFTLHNDSPVVLMGEAAGRNTFWEIIESAVNRKTMAGRVLGEQQKISVKEALQAVTINGAWQAREQKTKGSIKEGKIADLLILSDNPLSTNPQKLSNIRVKTTIKGGQQVYEEAS